MKKTVLAWGLLFSLIVSSASAQETHSEPLTSPAGHVYFMMRVAYPMPIEQIVFISHVYNANGIKAHTYMKPLTDAETADYMKNPGDFVTKYEPKAPESYRPTEAGLQKLASTMKPFEMNVVDGRIAQKYNVQQYPSILYFTPDGFLYRFNFPPYQSEATEKAFWQAYEKHAGNRVRGRGWSGKQWSQ